MIKFSKIHRKWRWALYGCLPIALILIFIAYFPLRIAMARWHMAKPDAILVLAGDAARFPFSARLAQDHPNMEIWYSVGAAGITEVEKHVKAGLLKNPAHCIGGAVDTVTNFTSIVDHLERADVRHVWLVTSDYHMRRASRIATVVLGSRGIAFTPATVSSSDKPESWWHATRDYMRALGWFLTGHTGASLRSNEFVKEHLSFSTLTMERPPDRPIRRSSPTREIA